MISPRLSGESELDTILPKRSLWWQHWQGFDGSLGRGAEHGRNMRVEGIIPTNISCEWLPLFIVSLKGEVPLQRNLVPQTPRGATLAFPIEVIYHSPSSTLSSIFVEDFEKLYTKLESEGRGRKTVKAQHLWFRILEAQMETGTPYMLYKDLLEAAVLEKPCGQRVGTWINNRNGIIYVIHWWFSLSSQRYFLLHVHCGLVACSKNSRLSVVGSRQQQVQSTELGHDPLLQPLHWDHWIHLSRWGENGGCGNFLRETFQNFCPPVHPLFRKCIPSDSEALQVAVCNLASIASWANQKTRFLERKSSKKCTDISGSWLVNYHNPHIDINLGANATWLLKMHNVWPGIWSTQSSACFQVANTHVWYWGYSLGCMAKILQNPDQIWSKKVTKNFGHFPQLPINQGLVLLCGGGRLWFSTAVWGDKGGDPQPQQGSFVVPS